MSACQAAEAEVSKVVNALDRFKSPSSFIYHVGHDLFVNGRDIFADVNSAIGAYKSQQWEQYGRFVGDALAKTLVGKPVDKSHKLSLSSSLTLTPEQSKALLVFKGVMEGMVLAEVPDLASCVGDVVPMFDNMAASLTEFEKKTTDGVERGLSDVGKALAALPAAMIVCKASEVEVAKVVKSLEMLSTPTTFVYRVGHNLIVDGHNIFTDVNGAIGAHKAEQWEQYGKFMGDALAKLVVGVTAVQKARAVPVPSAVIPLKPVVSVGVSSETSTELFYEGIIEGVTGSQSDDIKGCVVDSQVILSQVEEAFADLQTKTVDGVKKGMALLANAVRSIPNDKSECQSAQVGAKKLEVFLAAFETPQILVYNVGHNLVVNGKDIFSEINSSVGSFRAGDYESSGRFFGLAMVKIVLGSAFAASKPLAVTACDDMCADICVTNNGGDDCVQKCGCSPSVSKSAAPASSVSSALPVVAVVCIAIGAIALVIGAVMMSLSRRKRVYLDVYPEASYNAYDAL